MTEFVFRGPQKTTYPQYQHPEQPGVLVADPDEIIDFGPASPPEDGKWYDVVSGEPYTGPAMSVEEITDDSADQAQGTAGDQEE